MARNFQREGFLISIAEDAIPATPEVNSDFARLANPNLNLTPIDQARIISDIMFPQEWKKEHPNYLSYLPTPKEPISPGTVQLQAKRLAVGREPVIDYRI